MNTRYVVGIDLGTTGSAMAFVDTARGDDAPVELFAIPQLTGPGELDARPTLPSFLYLPAEADLPPGALSLPWNANATDVVGELARSRGAEVPGRVVSSAKSWLCHGGVDRRAPILPWGGQDVPLASPVDVSARYVAHMVAAWDAAHPDAPLSEQDVVLTVPASFDVVARELTVEAVRAAGLPQVTLLEEPLAAFYAWIQANGDAWRKTLAVGDNVLVCDIGGGTTDFSLITVTESEGNLSLERVAVGDHILLGGDNMDLALAYAVTQKLAAAGKTLDAWQERGLQHSCRIAKERLLASDFGGGPVPVTVLGRGSKVLGGTLRADLTQEDVAQVLVEGFFPRCAANDRPQRSRRVGMRELGLPYATDAAVTRHLADFIARHGRTPTAVLYNGGVMKSDMLRGRLGDVIQGWTGAPLKDLDGPDLDLAVAQGAAVYGMVRRGRGLRVRGGAARAYYIGVETAMPAVPGMAPPLKALCVVPFGMEEGSQAPVPGHELGLLVGEPAEFRFFGSSVRKDDATGTLLSSWGDELEELAPVCTELEKPGSEPGDAVPVTLDVHMTAVGTVELWCVGRDGQRWKLEYDVRETH